MRHGPDSALGCKSVGTNLGNRMPTRTPIRTASPTLRALFEQAESLGIAQGEIAARIDSRQHVIFRYRAGQREPGIMTVEALAHALGMRISLVPAARN